MKNSPINKAFFNLLMFMLLSMHGSATHIIGGEINYRCLGNSMYEITLQLFRDCDTGVPWFEDPATIDILDMNGNFVDTIDMVLRNNDTLEFTSSACSVISPSACIHTTTYREVRFLPFRPGGYQFLYQICCRNQDIINIIDPTGTGAAYHSVMSEEALLSCNNAARFDDWPSFYICNGQPLNYDHSATDVDGDSISYELCTPYDIFASVLNKFVEWKFPYNLGSMLGGSLPLAIDPVTGVLSGTPFTNGIFVVGICANEYRNGVLISRTRRDFQFIVTSCVVSIVADFLAEIDSCNTKLTIPFSNLSNPINGPFIWDFGDGTPISTDVSPSHAFIDTGSYSVMLIAGMGTPCEDTVIQEIRLDIEAADIDVISAPIICNEEKVLLVAYNIFSEYNDIISYNWSPPGNIISGQGTDSVWMQVSGGSFGVMVEVVNNFGCRELVQLTEIDVPIDIIKANFDSIAFVCNRSLNVQFINQSVSSIDQYLWNFNDLRTSTDLNPSYTFPDTGWYTITLVAGVGHPCQDTFERDIYIPLDGAEIAAIDSQITCQQDTILLTAIDLGASYYPITNYTWTPSDVIVAGQGTDSVWVVANADLDFTVVATNAKNCKDTTSARVNVSSISPIVGVSAIPYEIYLGQTSNLLTYYDLDYTYSWLPDTTLNALDIHNPTARPRTNKTYYVTVKNSFDCVLTDSVVITILPPLCGNPVVFVPSAFTPNNDGHNDVLMVHGNNINEMTMVIYDRWGQKLFETQDQSIGWDGTLKGKALPPDVYGYYMQCRCDDGSQAFFKGNITLLR